MTAEEKRGRMFAAVHKTSNSANEEWVRTHRNMVWALRDVAAGEPLGEVYDMVTRLVARDVSTEAALAAASPGRPPGGHRA